MPSVWQPDQIQNLDKFGDQAVTVILFQDFQLYPDEMTAESLYNGIKYKDLPIVTIVCHKNNTKFYAEQANGTKLHYTAPSHHGFINAKKRTNVGKLGIIH